MDANAVMFFGFFVVLMGFGAVSFILHDVRKGGLRPASTPGNAASTITAYGLETDPRNYDRAGSSFNLDKPATKLRKKFVEVVKAKPALKWLSEIIAPADGQYVHTVVAGGTGSGKTTMQYGFIVAASEIGSFIVISLLGTPRNFGIPASEIHGIGDKPQDALKALQGVEALRSARATQQAQGVEDFNPVFLFIDEYPDLTADPVVGETVAAIVKKLARTGRQLGIFLRLTAQDTLVETLGFPRTILDANFTRVSKGVEAVKLADGAVAGSSKHATTVRRLDGSIEAVDSSIFQTVQQAYQPDMSHIWQPPATVSNGDLLDLDTNTANSIPAKGDVSRSIPPEYPVRNGMELSAAQHQAVVEAFQAGLARSTVAALLGGRRENRMQQLKEIAENLN